MEATQIAATAGALTVALTNTPGPALAGAADLHIDIHVGPELSVAATKSYTAELLSLWLLVDAWRGGDAAAARAVPAAVEQVLDQSEVKEVAARVTDSARSLVIIGFSAARPA